MPRLMMSIPLPMRPPIMSPSVGCMSIPISMPSIAVAGFAVPVVVPKFVSAVAGVVFVVPLILVVAASVPRTFRSVFSLATTSLSASFLLGI